MTPFNLNLSENMRNRIEAWRADQFKISGQIPSITAAIRTLVDKGLVADGHEVVEAE